VLVLCYNRRWNTLNKLFFPAELTSTVPHPPRSRAPSPRLPPPTAIGLHTPNRNPCHRRSRQPRALMWLGRMARLCPDGHGLSRALDGDTTILPLQRRMSSSWRSVVAMLGSTHIWWGMHRWRCACSRGERECATVGSCRPPSWCGVLMAATMSWSTSWCYCFCGWWGSVHRRWVVE
jgi:hypothetical protein